MATSKERLKELTDRLEAGLQELFTSEKYMEYLKVMSQFHHYSVNNTMLIALQKPEATLVAGYQAWEKKFKRHVMKGEKGIRIISPAPRRETVEKEKKDPRTGAVILGADGKPETEEVTVTIPRFVPSVVFDVSQTEGEPLPQLGVEELTADVDNYKAFMAAIGNVSPAPIRFAEIAGSARGYYDNAAKEIVVKEGMGQSQTMKTAIHETVHALLHDRDFMEKQGVKKDKETIETEAESCAFVVCAHFGLDTSDYSFPYIAGWSSSRETKELKASMNTIRRTAGQIIDGIEENMRRLFKERQEEKEKGEDEKHEVLPYTQCAYETPEGYFSIHSAEGGYDYSFFDRNYKLLDGGLLEDEPGRDPRTIDQAVGELFSDNHLKVENCREVSYDELTDHTDDANRPPAATERMKTGPAYYVAECMEFPVMGEYHDHLTLDQAVEIYESIPSDRMHGIKGIGIELDDGSDYCGSIDLMQGGRVDTEMINRIDHLRESPFIQKALQELREYYPDGARSQKGKESVLQALKERQKRLKVQDKDDMQKGGKEKKKGELTI